MKRRSTLPRPSKAPVALKSEVVQEDLPCPVVYYPNHYGTFFAFAESEGEPVLCSCCEPAMVNLIRLLAAEDSTYGDPLKMAPLSSRYFPDRVASVSLGNSSALEPVRFGPDLCHRCNGAKPTLRYCHEMYGTEFAQYYGWYINQAYLRLGILPLRLTYLPDVCASEYQQMLRNPTDLHNNIENMARKEFGFPDIGEGWVSETLLFNVVKKLLPGEEVVRHHRAGWLDGLELDVYIPRLRLAIEYQGVQHFQPVDWWGGAAAFSRQKERDRRKERLCESARIRLIAFVHSEAITEENVARRIWSSTTAAI